MQTRKQLANAPPSRTEGRSNHESHPTLDPRRHGRNHGIQHRHSKKNRRHGRSRHHRPQHPEPRRGLLTDGTVCEVSLRAIEQTLPILRQQGVVPDRRPRRPRQGTRAIQPAPPEYHRRVRCIKILYLCVDCTCVDVDVGVDVDVYVYVSVHMYVCLHTHTHTHTHISIHMYIYI